MKTRKGHRTDRMPMVRTTSGHYVPWNRQAIVRSLLKETALAKMFLETPAITKGQAEDIALKAEGKVRGMELKFVSGPLIREVVNNVLLEEFGNPNYRTYRNIMTRVGTPVYDAFQIDIGEGFEAKENANLQPNAETAHKKKSDKTSKEEYLLLMPMEQADAHLRGDIHIHDLEYFGTRPFCQNWDLRYFFYYGFMPDGLGFKTSVAGPAKRPEVAVLHSVKVLAAAQTNFAGGEGFYNYLVFLAPYMRGLSYDSMKQLMQMMFFELTQMYVARGGQPVFSNIQIMPTVPEIWADKPVVCGGRVGPDTYGSYGDEVKLLYRAINEVALGGDHWGKPFNFPKLENGITPNTFKPEIEEELFLAHEIAAKFGSPYFDNMIPAYRGYGKGVSCYQCCSYNFVETSDTDEEFKEKIYFEGGSHFSMGSWQVVTLNLPRAAYRARGEDGRLFEELRRLMDLSMEVFRTKSRWMDLMLKNERMPFATQRPMDPSGGRRGPPAVDFGELVYTIGLVGANEMAQYHTGRQLHESDDSVKLAVRAVLEMKKHLRHLHEETGMKLALARTPAESCAQRLAVCDLLSEELRDKARGIVKGDLNAARKMLGQGERDVPVYYSNGTHVFVGAKMPLMDRMRIENKFFPILDGGNMFHVWLGEGGPDPESLMKMTKRISTQTQIGYFAYTRDLTICQDCNMVEGGVHKLCTNCRSPRVRWWSRVTGYYQDVGGWNSGKREEFRQRFRTDLAS
jgi:anaerobic ribonucleoside-triphosphate reductase